MGDPLETRTGLQLPTVADFSDEDFAVVVAEDGGLVKVPGERIRNGGLRSELEDRGAFGQWLYPSVGSMLAIAAYGNLVAGDIIKTDKYGFEYEVMPIIAANHDLETAGGVKLKFRSETGGANILAFGAAPSATAAQNTLAIRKAMIHLLNKHPEIDNYYPGGPGDPTDYYHVNRQAGRIVVPSGRYKHLPQMLNALNHPREHYCGFEFVGDGRMSSILLMETGGVESYLFDNGVDSLAMQQTTFRDIGFRSDDYSKGSALKMWSAGGPKQPRFAACDFQNLQSLLLTSGTGNADLSKFLMCTGHFYGAILVLDNDQSVQHDFIGSDFGTYGDFCRVKQHGGGNVTITNASIDFIFHEDYSPAGGNAFFAFDSNANVGKGNCTFTLRDSRVEVEAYMRGAGNPPFNFYRSDGDDAVKMPRVDFSNVTFVNGATYIINGAGAIIGSERRRIVLAKIGNSETLMLDGCVLLKNFFYEVRGVNNLGSPNAGALIQISDCFDGTDDELPAADSQLKNLHLRTSYADSAGIVITRGMRDHTQGSPFIREMLDCAPRASRAFGRDRSIDQISTFFKPKGNGWPKPAGGNEHFLNVPPGVDMVNLSIWQPAEGASTNAYQLHFGTTDRSIIFGSSALAQHKDEHIIDLKWTALSPAAKAAWLAGGQFQLWATGAGDDFKNDGYARVDHF